MTNDFLATYLEKLGALTSTFPADLADYAAQEALKTLQANWKDAASDAGRADTKSDADTEVFGIASMQADIAKVIEVLEHFQENLQECTRADLGEYVLTPDRVISVLEQRLKLAPLPAPAFDNEGDMLVYGAFYETPEGIIAKAIGSVNAYELAHYYLDDGAFSRHTVSFAEFRTWTRRKDLRDFPEARDPLLPYEFDLNWDIKYMSDLGPYLKSCSGSTEEAELRDAISRHGIKIPGAAES